MSEGLWHSQSAVVSSRVDMSSIPDALRFPLTFVLSGALHAAALSNLTQPPRLHSFPHEGDRLEVRLQDRRPVEKPVPFSMPVANTRPASPPPLTPPRTILPARVSAARTQIPMPESEIPPAEEPPTITTYPLDSEHASKISTEMTSMSPNRPSLKSGVPPPLETASVNTNAADGAAFAGMVAMPPDDTSGNAEIESAGTLGQPFPAPRIRQSRSPDYPEEARWEKRTGVTTLGFHIKSDGSVTAIMVLHSSGHADLDTAAIKALRQWRFELPTKGTSTSWYRYLFRFELT